MFEQDYLMRMIAELIAGMRRSMERATGLRDPRGAAAMLEAAVGDAAEMDAEALLSLAPESIADVLAVTGVDPHVTEYLARSLALAGRYRAEAGEADLAALRQAQARAIAEAWGHDLGDDAADPASVEAFLARAERAGA
ncbi:MAG: hypothetical protein HFJ75_04815 [Eggerthellaceae bacterium]|nr:hypothetical protein [Eggerthellaceae bacterium]